MCGGKSAFSFSSFLLRNYVDVVVHAQTAVECFVDHFAAEILAVLEAVQNGDSTGVDDTMRNISDALPQFFE